MKNVFTQLKWMCLLFTSPFLLIFNCQTPLPVEHKYSYGEMESVWQYLKVYSIYQDRVPANPYVFSNPEKLLESIKDSLCPRQKTTDCNVFTRYAKLSVPEKSASVNQSSPGDTTKFVRLTDSTCYIRIPNFYESTDERFEEAFYKAEQYNCKKIIFDLRNNGGGNLAVLVNMIELLLPPDIPYILARERYYNDTTKKASTLEWHPWLTPKTSSGELNNIKYAILMNGGSASASEIFIAALKDCQNAVIIGDTTYGKAIGQVTLPRRGRDSLQITYLQLKGITNRTGDYHKKGIIPDTIPASVINSYHGADSLKYLFYALKMLEPSANWPISLPQISVSNGQRSIGLYKIIHDSSMSN